MAALKNTLGRPVSLNHDNEALALWEENVVGKMDIALGVANRNCDLPNLQKSIVLCTDERTGSKLLSSHMATTGVLGRPLEYFNTWGMRLRCGEYPDDIADQYRIARHLGTTPNGVFSLKMHWWAMERVVPAFPLFSAPNVYFVYLTRDDILGQAISLVKARQTNQWVSSQASSTSISPRYEGELISSVLKDLTVNRGKWEIYFARNGIHPFRVTYEKLVADRQLVINHIAQYAKIEEESIIGREQFFVYEKQADAINDLWRSKFISEFGNLYAVGDL